MNHQIWEQAWQHQHLPWDLGQPTPGLAHWLAIHSVEGSKILVPGCGLGHDAWYLAEHGAQITALDVAATALAKASQKYKHPDIQWVHADILEFKRHSSFDRVWEYTSFCAIDPKFRDPYIKKQALLLKPGGFYWGFVYTRVKHSNHRPPFPIEADRFKRLLDAYFSIEAFEQPSLKSVRSRRGKELWFVARKK